MAYNRLTMAYDLADLDQSTRERETVWQKFECERGNRWTSVVGSPFNDYTDGATCYFSGCQQDHVYHARGYANRSDAHDWFRNVNAQERRIA